MLIQEKKVAVIDFSKIEQIVTLVVIVFNDVINC